MNFLQLTVFGLLVTVAIISSSADAKLFKKKKWLPKILGLGVSKGLGNGIPAAYEEHPKIVEIVKHVPVIQKVEVIKPVEIIKVVNVPGKCKIFDQNFYFSEALTKFLTRSL